MTTTLTGRPDQKNSVLPKFTSRDRSSALSQTPGVAFAPDADDPFRAFLERLNQLARLPGDWNPGSPVISGGALARASDIVHWLRRLGARSIPEMSPTNSGGVLLEWRSPPPFRAAIEIAPNVRLVFFAEDSSGVDLEGEVPDNTAEFVEALRSIARFSE